jgi:predicted PurR-regulated permease PerM
VHESDVVIGYASPPPGRVASVVLLVVGFGIVGALLWPFVPALVLAAVMATLAQPLHRRVVQRVRRPGAAALVTTLGMVFLLLIPLSIIAFLVGTQAVRGLQLLQEQGPSFDQAGDGIRGVLAGLAQRLGIDPAGVESMVTTQLQRVGSALATRTLGFLSGLGGWLLQLGVGVFTLFYLLRDGDQLIAGLRRTVPLESDRVDRFLERARDVTQATVFGNVLVAVVQGTLGGFAFSLLGLPAATLWGTVMGFMSLIPMVGPAIVWVPAAILLVVQGQLVRAIVLAAIGVLVIGTVDNVLRAFFVGGRARVHSLVVFLGVLGGLFLFGAIGVVAGPVLFVLALLALEMGRLASEPAALRPPVIIAGSPGREIERPPE